MRKFIDKNDSETVSIAIIKSIKTSTSWQKEAINNCKKVSLLMADLRRKKNYSGKFSSQVLSNQKVYD